MSIKLSIKSVIWPSILILAQELIQDLTPARAAGMAQAGTIRPRLVQVFPMEVVLLGALIILSFSFTFPKEQTHRRGHVCRFHQGVLNLAIRKAVCIVPQSVISIVIGLVSLLIIGNLKLFNDEPSKRVKKIFN